MSILNPEVVNESVFFNRDECVKAGKDRLASYTEAQPFPHIVMDDFLSSDILKRVVTEFPERKDGRFADKQSNLKTGYQLEAIESPYITNLLSGLNSVQFLQFLEEMTGIKGLLPDPYFVGGGLHETARGGHLSIHVDFNVHPRFMLQRRMNLIVFLNDNWEEEWGGNLELWNKDMESRAKSVSPVMGRAVVFNTDEGSYHGHPEPLNSPDTVFRRSLALYYYTIPENPQSLKKRTTQFQVRPGSKDEVKRETRMRQIWHDLCPPLLRRKLQRS